jgi:hypothetical protein
MWHSLRQFHRIASPVSVLLFWLFAAAVVGAVVAWVRYLSAPTWNLIIVPVGRAILEAVS